MKTRAPAMKVRSTRAPRSAHPRARLNKKSIYMYEINYGTKPVMLRIRIRWICMFLGLLDPDPDPLLSKTLIPTFFLLLFDFLSLKNDINVHSKSNKQKNCVEKLVFCWHLEGQCRK
jgi:hypothetical protein